MISLSMVFGQTRKKMEIVFDSFFKRIRADFVQGQQLKDIIFNKLLISSKMA